MTDSPVSVVVHIVSAIGYTILGALQFSASLRRRRPGGPAVFGVSLLTLDLSLGVAWVINLAIAEYVIGRPGHRRTNRPAEAATANVGS
ncbi:MAG TPA: hypothetical protein VFU98_18775 [Microlunatus sp.]|nr:hypothetical protein [Microlunatus sp.]